MEFFSSVITFFQTGGAFMYPILFVFAIGLAIALERYFVLTRTRNVNRRIWDEVHPVLEEGKFDEARAMIDERKSTISQMLNMGLIRQGSVRRRDDIEIAMEESLMEIVPQLEKRTPFVCLLYTSPSPRD